MTEPASRDLQLIDARSPAFGYFLLCVASTAATGFFLMGSGQSALVGVLFLIAGLTGVFMRISIAPPLVVVCAALSLMLRQWFFLEWADQVDPEAAPRIRPRDMFLAVAVLGYVIGHYRLQALGWHVFPPDYRHAYLERVKQLPTEAWHAVAHSRRGVHLVKPQELILAVITLPLWAMAAQLLWLWLAAPRGFLGWGAQLARIAVFVIALVPPVLLTWAALRHWRLRKMQALEARLLMQDVLWNELRGQFRWISRWLAWIALRQRQDQE